MKRRIITCQSGALDISLLEINTEQWSVEELCCLPFEGVLGTSAAMPAVRGGDMVYVAFRGEKPSLLSFRLDENRRRIEQVGHLEIPESCPYLSMSENGKFLLAAGGSSALSVCIGADGALGAVVSRAPLGDLAHCVRQSNGKVFGTACRDDLLRQYSLDDVDGTLKELARVSFPKGSGPRHIVPSQDGCLLYIITENAGSISTVSVDGKDGPVLQSDVTLIDDASKMWAGDLVMSHDAHFLFASERASDQLVAIEIDEEAGLLKPVYRVQSPDHVRSLFVAPDDGFLVAMGNFGNQGRVYSIECDGRLIPKTDFLAGDGPSWVLGGD
nr:beta-propeller fold lactonase family protein [uncultured Cohaesibacter sp.]